MVDFIIIGVEPTAPEEFQAAIAQTEQELANISEREEDLKNHKKALRSQLQQFKSKFKNVFETPNYVDKLVEALEKPIKRRREWIARREEQIENIQDFQQFLIDNKNTFKTKAEVKAAFYRHQSQFSLGYGDFTLPN